MIQLSPDARLSIILPNTNKALSEAIKHATPEQLETLKEGKDIKSLLTSIFQDKTTASKSDQTLLELLRNSSAFKNMGSFSDSLQSLVQELKTSSRTTTETAVLEKFLKNVSTIDPQSLKNQIASSGVFMESKFAAALHKLPDLIETLQQLKTALSENYRSDTKALQTTLTTLLENLLLSKALQNPESAASLSQGLKIVVQMVQTTLSKTDPLFSKEVANAVQKLDQNGAVSEIKHTLSQLYGTLLKSNVPESNDVLDAIEKLLRNLSPSSAEEVNAFARHLRDTLMRDNTEELYGIAAKLEAFTDPKSLITETFLKESMADDLKSNLLSLREELTLSGDPADQKLLEQTDRLLTQIDYHQLLSHIGSSNSIYFPFVWDQLQEGSLTFKKNKENKFYCEIRLKLKEYGDLNLMMALYEGNQLDIQAHTEKPELKALIHENIGELRTLLIRSGLTPRSIRIYEATETKTPIQETYAASEGTDMGFEVKV